MQIIYLFFFLLTSEAQFALNLSALNICGLLSLQLDLGCIANYTQCLAKYLFYQADMLVCPPAYLLKTDFYCPILDGPLINSGAWMTQKINNLSIPISGVVYPGTHDSASTLFDWNIGRWQCQVWNTLQQLQVGIRFFDLRASYFNSSANDPTPNCDLPVYHGPIYQGTCLKDHFDDMKSFLLNNTGEWILVRLSQENQGSMDASATAFGARILQLMNMNNYSDLFVRSSTIPTVEAARGHIVLFSDAFDVPGDVAIPWHNNPDLTIQDDYNQEVVAPVCCNKICDIQAQQDFADFFGGFNFNFASGSGSNLPPVPCAPRDVAYITNHDLKSWLTQEQTKDEEHNYGVIAMDFPSQELVQLIISLNN